ncbi:MAG: hydrolase [Granulosicoccus sp.]
MIIESKFSPTWWLRNPHLQTVLASKVCKPPFLPTVCERIELADGDFIDINLRSDAHGDIVAIFHGLAGCITSSYIQGAFQSLHRRALCPILMHWRGCSGEPNRLKRSYHSGASDDVAWFIRYLGQRYPDRRIHALGYSLGANALLKYLGESGQNSGVSSAVAVCPPLVLRVGADKLASGVARCYQSYLLKLMRQHHESKRDLYPELALPPATGALDNFWKFDNELTAPLHGFNDVHDYYAKCSARPYLPQILTPTRILCSLDDPFFTPEILPDQSELSKTTTLEVSRYGGHVGYLTGLNEGGRWLDSHVADLFDQSSSNSRFVSN